MIRPILTTAMLAVGVGVLAPAPAHAQFGKLKDKVKQRVEQKVDKKVDCKLDEYIDRKECAAEKKAAAAAADGGPAKAANSGGADAAALRPGQGAWANFDFVPGERPLFIEDFARDRVGNFPKRLELGNGTFEIVEWQGKRWLSSSGQGGFTVNLPEALPQRWTMEFDATIPWNGMYVYPSPYRGSEPNIHQAKAVLLGLSSRVSNGKGNTTEFDVRNLFGADLFNGALTQPMRVRVHADGAYMKVYVNEKRVANMPNMGRWEGNQIHFWYRDNTHDGAPASPLINNISINAGGKDMYDALAADGRLALQGIYFDTGSDRIRPESSGTLAEIAAMLSEHPDLNITIEGHTDNVGDAAANQKLSDARAAAVVQALSGGYKIDAARLKSVGFGASKPAKPNDTPEGRQANRRVELVKN